MITTRAPDGAKKFYTRQPYPIFLSGNHAMWIRLWIKRFESRFWQWDIVAVEIDNEILWWWVALAWPLICDAALEIQISATVFIHRQERNSVRSILVFIVDPTSCKITKVCTIYVRKGLYGCLSTRAGYMGCIVSVNSRIFGETLLERWLSHWCLPITLTSLEKKPLWITFGKDYKLIKVDF